MIYHLNETFTYTSGLDVESSFLKWLGYDSEREQLYVEFKDRPGVTMVYYGVPGYQFVEATARGGMGHSVGEWYNLDIKGEYPGSMLENYEKEFAPVESEMTHEEFDEAMKNGTPIEVETTNKDLVSVVINTTGNSTGPSLHFQELEDEPVYEVTLEIRTTVVKRVRAGSVHEAIENAETVQGDEVQGVTEVTGVRKV